jgi:hypothetical protein
MKTKLFALEALALANFPFLAADVAQGAEFEVDATHAEPLLTAGKAKLVEPPLAPAPKVKTVKVRVLTDCAHGKCDTVAELPADVAKQAEEGGLVDTNKAAVAACAAAAAPAEQ